MGTFDSLTSFLRVFDQLSVTVILQVANRLAATVGEWTSLFEPHNSGTYPNQWVVVDPKRRDEATGFVAISEQTVGLIKSQDVTAIVTQLGC